MVSDPGRAAAPRIPVQPVLPSTVLSGSASAVSSFSGLNTYPIRSLCTLCGRRHRRPRNTRYRAARYDPTRAGLPPAGPRQLRLAHQHSLPGGPLRPYLGRTFTGRIAPASLGALSLELSRSTWLVTSLSPDGGEKMSKHSVPGGDVSGLLESGRGETPSAYSPATSWSGPSSSDSGICRNAHH